MVKVSVLFVDEFVSSNMSSVGATYVSIVAEMSRVCLGFVSIDTGALLSLCFYLGDNIQGTYISLVDVSHREEGIEMKKIMGIIAFVVTGTMLLLGRIYASLAERGHVPHELDFGPVLTPKGLYHLSIEVVDITK